MTMMRSLVWHLMLTFAMSARQIPRQTPTQLKLMERFAGRAKSLSAAATPELLDYLASDPFRTALEACCPVAAAMPAPKLLQALRDEHGGAEMVHNFGSGDGGGVVEDTCLDVEINATAFYNIWEFAWINGSFGVKPCTSLTEVDMFGFPPFTGGNKTDPGSRPRSFAEATERPIYAALNSRAVDSGNPTFGPLSVVFRPSYVRNMTFVAPLDTGIWEMSCNGSDIDSGGGRFGRQRQRLTHGMHLLNCSAWAGRAFGTLDHLDHLLLLSERLWLNASTILETLNRLFELVETAHAHAQQPQQANESTALPIDGLQVMHYMEADLAGNALLPHAVKSVLAQARLLGTATAAALRDWCVGNGWALLWSAGPHCLTPANNTRCYGENASSWSSSTVRGTRVLDPLVVARLGRAHILPALPPGAQAAFERVEGAAFGAGGAMNDTDRSERVMTPRVQAGWEALLQAVPAEARMRALRAADGCDLDRCVGAEAAAPVGNQPRCTCYQDANVSGK
jgi:hypothetical protein